MTNAWRICQYNSKTLKAYQLVQSVACDFFAGGRRHPIFDCDWSSDVCSSDLRVPLGTVVADRETGELVADLTTPGQRVLAIRGARGGRGNARFASSTNRAPRRADLGRPGPE